MSLSLFYVLQLFKNRLSSAPTSQSCNQLSTIEKNNSIETAQQKQPQKLVTTLEAAPSASASRSNNPFLRESSSNDTLPLQDDNGQKEKKEEEEEEMELDENDDTILNGGRRPVSPIKLIRPCSAPLAYTEDSR